MAINVRRKPTIKKAMIKAGWPAIPAMTIKINIQINIKMSAPLNALTGNTALTAATTAK